MNTYPKLALVTFVLWSRALLRWGRLIQTLLRRAPLKQALSKQVLWSAALASGLTLSPALCAANAVIDVLVVYTKGTADAYGGDPTTRINQLFQVSNQIYRDSGVAIELRIAQTLEVNYTDNNSADTALNDITYAKHAAFAGVAAAREQARADMVILYRPFKAVQESCGLAWINGQGSNGDFSAPRHKKFMFAHIAINSCGDFVTAHELGHNMGLKHSRKQDGSGGTFPYALGYGEVNGFTTIMAYQSEFNVDYWSGKLYKFSNPDLSCKGRPCGVSRNDPINGADARSALNITGPQIANFYSASTSASSAKTRFAASSAAVAPISVAPISVAPMSVAGGSAARGSFAIASARTVLAAVATSQSSSSNASASSHFNSVSSASASSRVSAASNLSASSYFSTSSYFSSSSRIGANSYLGVSSDIGISRAASSSSSAASAASLVQAIAATALGE